MKNKNVGYIILSIAILFLFLVISFNNALTSFVNNSCTHGIECPMHITLKTQKILSYGLIGIISAFALYLIFKKEERKSKHKPHIETNQNQEPTKKETIEIHNQETIKEPKETPNLDEEEQNIINLLNKNEGSIYQSDIIKETNLSKVKVSRLLDKLEGKGLIERKRRGMTNIVIKKHQ
jgi:uncharacterized membrane protein